MHSINLLPWREHQQEYRKKRMIYLTIATILVTAIILSLARGYVKHEQRDQQQKNRELQNYTSDTEIKLKTVEEIQSQHQIKLNQLNHLQGLKADRNKVINSIDTISELILDGVYLDKITMNKNQFEIIGVGESTHLLSEMLNHFEQKAGMSQVELHSIVHNTPRFERQLHTFNLSFQAKSPTQTHKKEESRGDDG